MGKTVKEINKINLQLRKIMKIILIIRNVSNQIKEKSK